MKPKQLTFDDYNPDWWRDASLWAGWQTIDIVDRATENSALNNIYLEARVASGRTRIVLTELEREIDDIDHRILKHQRHPTTQRQRAIQIVNELRHVTLFQVIGIMDDIAQVKRDYARMEGINKLQAMLDDKRTSIFEQALREVLHEDVA